MRFKSTNLNFLHFQIFIINSTGAEDTTKEATAEEETTTDRVEVDITKVVEEDTMTVMAKGAINFLVSCLEILIKYLVEVT